jgi:hypothetical protein
MKIKIIIALILGLVTSCRIENSHKMKVYMSNGDRWHRSSTELYCDSVTMVNKNNAIVYINGYKSTIYADVILLIN